MMATSSGRFSILSVPMRGMALLLRYEGSTSASSPTAFQSEESVMRATAKNLEKLTTRHDERSMKGIRDNIREAH